MANDRDSSTVSTRDRDADRPSERRHREKKERDPNRPRKPRPIDPDTGLPIRRKKRDKDKEREREERHRSRETLAESEVSRNMSEIVPELGRTRSIPGSREHLPYPSLNKGTSKESVYSKVDLSTKSDKDGKGRDPYTPEPTDVGKGRSRSTSRSRLKVKTDEEGLRTKDRPLTPPETEFTTEPRRKSSTKSTSGTPTSARASKIREDELDKTSRPNSRGSDRSWFGRPKVVKVGGDGSKVSTKSKESKASTARRTSKPTIDTLPQVEIIEDDSDSDAAQSQPASGLDSNATSVAPKKAQPPPPIVGSHGKPPGLDTDSGQSNRESASPRTPTAPAKFDQHDPKSFAAEIRPTPSPFVSFDHPQPEANEYNSPQPPPPPPPPAVPANFARVDYLMQNGGLFRTVPKSLLAVTPAYPGQPFIPGRTLAPGPPEVDRVFTPFHQLLDQYDAVLEKNGSIAVATGYRSIARKLLDRLENIFARELMSEGCTCVICNEPDDAPGENKALGWGEVLEWVSGRRPLPAWPPFDFASVAKVDGLGITSGVDLNGRPASPQKIDPDIAEEFREHYLRQSKKTKAAVDKWLHSTPTSAASLPADIDDETLTFTTLTYLDPEDRTIYNALMTGSGKPVQSTSRAPTPLNRLKTDFISKTAAALQRLYRLGQLPRDPEAGIYLLKNPHVHNLLVTLSLINQSEWEILISGRFDGFLWSGADGEMPDMSAVNSPAPSRGPTPANGMPGRQHSGSFSRMTTPFSNVSRNNTLSPTGIPSRGPTPNQFGAPPSIPGTPAQHGRQPVSNDEEMEIAVLAEVEREIYSGMEALEDAFEALHRKAEKVRSALRARGAGLSMTAQARRSGADTGAFARLGTPGMQGPSGVEWGTRRGTPAVYAWEASEDESDWGADERSEIAPDDSASNISSSRHRRPKRRNERRTPAPVEEEDEE